MKKKCIVVFIMLLHICGAVSITSANTMELWQFETGLLTGTYEEDDILITGSYGDVYTNKGTWVDVAEATLTITFSKTVPFSLSAVDVHVPSLSEMEAARVWDSEGRLTWWDPGDRETYYYGDEIEDGFGQNVTFIKIQSDYHTYIHKIVAAGIGSPEPVPEPATMVLFGTGLAGLAGYRRRQAKKK